MQIRPTPALLHAIARAGEPQAGVAPPPTAKPPEAARAAARAAFQAAGVPLQTQTPAPAPPVAPSQAPVGKTLPRGSFVNLLV